MQCSYYDTRLCRSCSQMGTPYARQLAGKDEQARSLLGHRRDMEWLEPVASPQEYFRNKAKIVVAGSVQDPTLGIVTRSGEGIDLSDCGLYDPRITAVMPVLRSLIRRAGLTPYSVMRRRGELKNILVTVSPGGETMVRFVLRSKKLVVPIRRELDRLRREIAGLQVVSVNLLREHVALVEGPEELILTEQQTLPMRLNGLTLHLRPQSFFQTNTAIAEALYRRGQDWVTEVGPQSLWDLYCGVGGFGLHAGQALGDRVEVTGIELSEQAVASARRSAAELGLENTRFEVGDAVRFALESDTGRMPRPEMAVVNPPRRGLGEELSSWLESSGVETLIYSSCNVKTLVSDLESMPSYTPVRAQVLDMFPHTTHYEVMTLLSRS